MTEDSKFPPVIFPGIWTENDSRIWSSQEPTPALNGLIYSKYLRADTCTPNEECVSKAELESLIGRWLDGLELCSDTPLVEVHRKERAALIKELREVMDK